MPISAEMEVFFAGLGNNMTWKKLSSDEEPDYTFINDLEEQVFDLVGRSDKAGGTTGHIGLVMTPLEFALIPGTTPFTPEDSAAPSGGASLCAQVSKTNQALCLMIVIMMTTIVMPLCHHHHHHQTRENVVSSSCCL